MSETTQDILVHTEAGVCTITFNRADKKNSIPEAMYAGMADALAQACEDAAVRCVVFQGDMAIFSAGNDIADFLKQSAGGAARPEGEQRPVWRFLHNIAAFPKPVIAAVNGAASGLGADTALACDFVIASEWASFAWSYVLRGIIPDGGGMYFLPRRVGLAKAKELIFTGRQVKLPEALALGIVDRQASAETLVADAQAWARELSSASSTALALTKTILNQSFELSSHDVFAQGSQAQGICYTSSEHRASVEAFLAKTAGKE